MPSNQCHLDKEDIFEDEKCNCGVECAAQDRRCLVEQIKTKVYASEDSSDNPEDYDYTVTTVRYGYSDRPDLNENKEFRTQPVSVELQEESIFELAGRGRRFNKYQLEAYIENLQTVLEKLD